MRMPEEAVFAFGILFLFYGGLGLVLLANYILRGVGILKMSRTLGRPNGWLGFIPYGMHYQLGSLAGDIEIGDRKMKNPGLWLLLVPLISGAVYAIAYFALIFGSVIRMTTMDYFYYYDEMMAMTTLFQLLGGLLIFYIILLVGVAVNAILRMMVLYRIYSFFYQGQRAVLLMLISGFVPFAEGILLIRHASCPVMTPPPYAQPPQYPYPPYPSQGYPYQQPYPPQDQGPYPPQ